MDAVDEALQIYYTTDGETQRAACRALRALQRMLETLGPLSPNVGRWEMLRAVIARAVGDE